jgi:hypothetical protein
MEIDAGMESIMQEKMTEEKLSDAVLKNPDLMKSFKKETYTKVFLAYKERYYPVLEAISQVWEAKEETEREVYLEALAAEYIEELSAAVKTAGKNRLARHDKTDSYRMIQALYTMPMILETRLPAAQPLAEKLVERWKAAYPKYIFLLGDYETLKKGFDKKQFCYITTAVCETLGKEDNCYELTMFRQFRDGYLRKQPDGEALILQYYDKAPEILMQIDRLGEKEEIYKGIWQTYLKPCLTLIEQGEPAACQEKYLQMVESLEKQYRN